MHENVSFFFYLVSMNILKTPIVNLSSVQEFCGLSRTVTEDEFNRFIISAQNLELRELLGEEMVDSIVTFSCAMSPPENIPLETLIENYVIPFVSHVSFQKYASQSGMQSLKSGIKRMTGEEVEEMNRNEKSAVQNFHQKESDSYGVRMLAFMESNLIEFPLYESKECEPVSRSIFTSKG